MTSQTGQKRAKTREKEIDLPQKAADAAGALRGLPPAHTPNAATTNKPVKKVSALNDARMILAAIKRCANKKSAEFLEPANRPMRRSSRR